MLGGDATVIEPDPTRFRLGCVMLPGRGEVVMIHAGPSAPVSGRGRWQREVQVMVDENGRARVWVDGEEI